MELIPLIIELRGIARVGLPLFGYTEVFNLLNMELPIRVRES